MPVPNRIESGGQVQDRSRLSASTRHSVLSMSRGYRAAVPSRYRDACVAILEAVADGNAEGRVSAAILEEVWHIELSGRAGKIDRLARRSYLLFTPLLPVSDDIVARLPKLEPSSVYGGPRLELDGNASAVPRQDSSSATEATPNNTLKTRLSAAI